MPGPQTQASAFVLAGAENATQAVQTLPEEAVQTQDEASHSAHAAPE
jgi:hypothetical protein